MKHLSPYPSLIKTHEKSNEEADKTLRACQGERLAIRQKSPGSGIDETLRV